MTSEAVVASEATKRLVVRTSDFKSGALLVASEAIAASKWPQSSNFTSDLEFVAQIAYATMFVWAV